MPLTLTAAKRHIGKKGKPVKRVVIERVAVEHPLEPVARRLDALAGPGAADCARRLRAVGASDREQALCTALAVVREFLVQRWEALDQSDRDARVASYFELLELDPHEPDGAGYATALGLARDSLRRDWPWLNAATLSELLT
ncbi:MAG: hypothetical protein KC912_20210 [Proteobacteria bacterium]|nr:hypothetical protein [Pseudomonadota bacterium]